MGGTVMTPCHSGLAGGRCPALVLALALAATPGCGPTTLESQRGAPTPTVDADLADWEGTLVDLEDGRFRVGARHDDRALHLAFAPRARADQIQLMLAGATIWVDPGGGTEKVWGVRIPPVPLVREREGPPDLETGLSELWASLAEIETVHVVDRDGAAVPLPLPGEDGGVRLALGDHDWALAVELTLPLGRSRAGLGTPVPASGAIGVGIETGELRRPGARREQMRGGPPGGPGGRRGEYGWSPPGGGSGRPDLGARIGLWVRVVLGA